MCCVYVCVVYECLSGLCVCLCVCVRVCVSYVMHAFAILLVMITACPIDIGAQISFTNSLRSIRDRL